MRRCFFLLSVLTLMVGMANAQIYTYVEQNGEMVNKLGTAKLDTQNTTPTVEFVNGKAVMTIGKAVVASVSVNNGGGIGGGFLRWFNFGRK